MDITPSTSIQDLAQLFIHLYDSSGDTDCVFAGLNITDPEIRQEILSDPKVILTILEAKRKDTDKVMQVLRNLLNDEDPSIRLRAANALMPRAFEALAEAKRQSKRDSINVIVVNGVEP